MPKISTLDAQRLLDEQAEDQDMAERDLAHEADMRKLYCEQLKADCGDDNDGEYPEDDCVPDWVGYDRYDDPFYDDFD